MATDPTGEPVRSGRVAMEVPRGLDMAARWSWRLLVVGAAIVLTAVALSRLRVVVIPMVVALFAVALLGPLVDLVGRVLPRLAATWVVVLGVLSALAGLGLLVASPLRNAFGGLRGDVDAAVTEIEDWLVSGPLGLSEQQVGRLRDGLSGSGDGFTSGWLDRPLDQARLVAEVLTGVFLAMALTFFFLKDGPSMWRWTVARVRAPRRDAVDRAGRAAFDSVQGWLRGAAITGVVDAVVIGVALVIIGVPAALPLAIITFFAAFFPIVGATVAGALAAAVALSANGIGDAIIVAVVVLVVQQVEGDVLLPIVMYRQVSLHPAVILLVLAAGGAIAGIAGAFVAVPLTAAISAAVSAAFGPFGSAPPDD